MESARIRKLSGIASIVFGVILVGLFFAWNDWVIGVVGVIGACIGIMTLYDLHTTS